MLNGALKFSPDECLDIVFSEGDNAETKLQITNIGLSPCIFKVKTTTPDRYLVKPNHGLIRQAAVTEISIVVVQSKKKDTGVNGLTKLALQVRKIARSGSQSPASQVTVSQRRRPSISPYLLWAT